MDFTALKVRIVFSASVSAEMCVCVCGIICDLTFPVHNSLRVLHWVCWNDKI